MPWQWQFLFIFLKDSLCEYYDFPQLTRWWPILSISPYNCLLWYWFTNGFYHLIVTWKKWLSLFQVTVTSQITLLPNDAFQRFYDYKCCMIFLQMSTTTQISKLVPWTFNKKQVSTVHIFNHPKMSCEEIKLHMIEWLD